MALYRLYVDGDNKPEIYICAGDRDQAGIGYRAAADMVHASRELDSFSKTTPSIKQIENTLNGGILKALSSDGSTNHGLSENCLIIDEYHALNKPGAYELLDALRTGLAKRRNSL